ncbi:hypothetical protein SNEBB_007889, partial [Seison nebaliae]
MMDALEAGSKDKGQDENNNDLKKKNDKVSKGEIF